MRNLAEPRCRRRSKRKTEKSPIKAVLQLAPEEQIRGELRRGGAWETGGVSPWSFFTLERNPLGGHEVLDRAKKSPKEDSINLNFITP